MKNIIKVLKESENIVENLIDQWFEESQNEKELKEKELI